VSSPGRRAGPKATAIEVAKDNISVNALAFAAIDIPGDMIWRFLDSQGIAPEQLVPMFPHGENGPTRGACRSRPLPLL
jgi:hypothetical protein